MNGTLIMILFSCFKILKCDTFKVKMKHLESWKPSANVHSSTSCSIMNSFFLSFFSRKWWNSSLPSDFSKSHSHIRPLYGLGLNLRFKLIIVVKSKTTITLLWVKKYIKANAFGCILHMLLSCCSHLCVLSGLIVKGEE